jgi:agmatine deiminase
MMTRRHFVQCVGALGADTLMRGRSGASSMTNDKNTWFMPDESGPHQRTWMAFGARPDIWGTQLLPVVQRELARIALTIAKYEPVSMLVRQSDLALARRLMGSEIELIICPLDDLWMRDMGAVFVVTENGGKAGIDFNFNGWGKRQDFDHDAKVANVVASHAHVQSIRADLVLEGGGVEVDGHGTAIMTESCILNDNRNPGVTKADCELELNRLLGLNEIIWLPGVKDNDITDGHTDFYARFAKPGVVVAGFDPDPKSFDHAVTRRHLEILRSAKDAQGRQLEVLVLETPSKLRKKFVGDHFAAGYINFYICNGAVIAPEFGDPRTDRAAKQTLQQLYRTREVIQLNIDGIAVGGGGIHCTTQQEPKV